MLKNGRGALRPDSGQTRDQVPGKVALRAVAPHGIVNEGAVTGRLRAELHNLRHEVHFVVAGEEHGRPSPHRKARQDPEDVFVAVVNVLVAPQLPRDAIHDDERLLVGAREFVRLIEELTRLQAAKEVAR